MSEMNKRKKIIKKKHNKKDKDRDRDRDRDRNNQEKNIFDLCHAVQNYMSRNCRKYNINPGDLYEEMHYQLPKSWVNKLRYVIKSSARISLKNEYALSNTDSSVESEI